MNIIRFLMGAIALLLASSASAATLELTDGTLIRGEIAEFRDGTYIVESEALGRVRVPERRVRAIDYSAGSTTSKSTSSNVMSGEIQQIQESIASNPALMASIQGLAANPEIQSILADPEIMKAVMSQDIGALMNNPKFMKLMNNPQLKAITKDVTGDR